MLQQPPRKRARPSACWSITFDDASSLKSVVDAAGAVMQRIMFKIARLDSRFFLMVDGADMGMTCCVSARLLLNKVVFGGGGSNNGSNTVVVSTDGSNTLNASNRPTILFTFCVDCAHVLNAIDSPSCAHATVIMEGYDETATIRLRVLDPYQHSYEDSADLNTFVDVEAQRIKLPLAYTLILEVDLVKLKELIKKARKVRVMDRIICGGDVQ